MPIPPAPRPATEADLPVVHALLGDAARWLRSRGIDQWQQPFPMALLCHDLETGGLHVAEDAAGQVVATVTLAWSDEEIWGDVAGAAGYVHRLAVGRRTTGAGMGAALLDWAAGQARERDLGDLRLDCAADNPGLRRWYERLGFMHVRDTSVCAPGGDRTFAISLYRRPVG